MGLRDKRPHRVGSPAPGGDPHRRRPLTWMGRRPGVGSAHLHTKDQSVRHRRAAAGRRSSRTPGRAAGDVTWKWQHSSSSQGCPAQRGGRLMAPRLRAPSGWTPDALPPSGRPNFHFPRKGTFSQVPERGRSASAQRVRRSRPESPRVSSSPAPEPTRVFLAREPEHGRRARPGRQPKAAPEPRGAGCPLRSARLSRPGLESDPSVLPWSGRPRRRGRRGVLALPPAPAEHPLASPVRSDSARRPGGPSSGWRGNDVRLRLKLCSALLLYLYPSPRRPSWVLTPVR